MNTVYLNGEFVALAEAKISVLDRGFIFGDGVYEVIPVYSRKPFRLAHHLQRLQHSLDGIRLANPHNQAEWAEIIQRLIQQHPAEDQGVYLQITRGVAPRDHAFPNPAVPPTVFVMSNAMSAPAAEQLQQGAHAISALDNRWLQCDLKATSLLPNVLLRQLAVDAQCSETLLFRDSRWLTEGAASNIFVVSKGVLLAPPKSNLMLPGITYDVVLELAQANQIPYQIRPIDINEVKQADELLMTSSTKEVMPITQLDGRPVGDGQAGPIFKQLYQLYQCFKRDVMRV